MYYVLFRLLACHLHWWAATGSSALVCWLVTNPICSIQISLCEDMDICGGFSSPHWIFWNVKKWENGKQCSDQVGSKLVRSSTFYHAVPVPDLFDESLCRRLYSGCFVSEQQITSLHLHCSVRLICFSLSSSVCLFLVTWYIPFTPELVG